METLLFTLRENGLALIFTNVLLEQLGLPLPAIPTLILAGVISVDGTLSPVTVLGTALLASTFADLAWYLAGKYHGHRVLALMCRVSLSPDSCVRQTESTFGRYGVLSLLFAKFVPGLSTIAPPLAGATGVSVTQFIIANTFGAFLWAGAGIGMGMIFYRQIDTVLNFLTQFGAGAGMLIGALLAVYIAWKWFDRWRFLRALRLARISVSELYELMEQGAEPVILDVRSATIREADKRMIPGAIAVDFDNLDVLFESLPPDREVIVYCSCPNDVSAAKVAKALHAKGLVRVRPLAGGIDAWINAGYTSASLST